MTLHYGLCTNTGCTLHSPFTEVEDSVCGMAFFPSRGVCNKSADHPVDLLCVVCALGCLWKESLVIISTHEPTTTRRIMLAACSHSLEAFLKIFREYAKLSSEGAENGYTLILKISQFWILPILKITRGLPLSSLMYCPSFMPIVESPT